MTTKELILALAAHVHVFGDDEVIIDQPGDRGFRVTGVSDGGILQVTEIVEVIEDEGVVFRDVPRGPEAAAEISEEENLEHLKGIAADHVAKGWYDDDDLELLGMTKDEARQADQYRQLRNAKEYMLQLDPAARRELLTELLADLADLAES